MNPVENILSLKKELCPVCSRPINDKIGYYYCPSCGFECSRFEWDRKSYSHLETTKAAQKRHKSKKLFAR